MSEQSSDSSSRAHPSPLVLPVGFRPQDVPVVAVDDALPVVPGAEQTLAALRARFASRPVWTPEWVNESSAGAGMRITPVRAAVLVPIVGHAQPTVLLTQRAAALRKHSGQIAFPGGRIDPGDVSAEAAALREAQEEIGLAPRRVEVLGELPSYVTGSGFEVVPVVGLVPPGLALHANPGEVDDIFEVPLAYLLNPANHRHQRYRQGEVSREWLSMPYQDAAGGERYIWGATASILRNFYRFMQAPRPAAMPPLDSTMD
ncbi:CoA pyrophosphatase [Corticibacter populi]|uniref:CoA pyrophosphatase n=1 Tax=Corticibacter populi TaxID=1550736 RepID=A0A3M6QZZ3_9BURK|nr:CoA pyrophosphatase [Corticibacter populi]RMX08580.1 CoA pyrophosphatase [Corticibacter populi]RZS35904.1 8-oxo-dGTP pyrophosphatase MutT (NUDIX family) [Corticibacter populi]